jgi:hypothetical protein
MPIAVQVPLTTGQKLRLLSECLPFIGFIVLCLTIWTFSGDVLGMDARGMMFKLFLVLVLFVLGFKSIERLRDLMSGYAIVAVDVIEHTSRAGNSGPGRGIFFSRFRQLGRFRIMRKAHYGSSIGQRYRITYSPISKIVWTLEPVN